MINALARFQFDNRSVVTLRIALGLLTIWMSVARLFNFKSFYSASGFMSESVIVPSTGVLARWLSPHFWFSADPFQYFLVVLTLLLGGLLCFGIRTRHVLLILTFLSLSHNLRFPLLVTGFEGYMPWLYLMAAVLPFAVAYTAFIGLTYWIAGLSKNWGQWWHGRALEAYLSDSRSTRPWAEFLTDSSGALHYLSKAVPVVEVLVPILLFAFFFNARARLALTVFMIAFHGIILAVMRVDELSLICMASWLPFLPALFWEKVGFANPVRSAMSDGPLLRKVGTAMLLVLAVFYCNAGVKRVSHGRIQPLRDQLVARSGFLLVFSHFASGTSASRWLQIMGRGSEGWLEVLVPDGKLGAPYDGEWPADLYEAKFGGNRYWLKALTFAQQLSAHPRVTVALREYLCRHFGSTSVHGLVEFKWVSHYQMRNREEPEAKDLLEHGCP